ncbi:hypothetical protein [Streptomyces sp. S.PB5]|uniref:hypothetical protein n=1 Tax=Streptomyces sp. S.PB5 TaxID=3020844 RepID=UPI0025B26BD5|nr:hypothetical protein [Streptomyces sp. S.PB5]MDN3029443.1 hypothetical protein [Streptomyces sp. S.PB5]
MEGTRGAESVEETAPLTGAERDQARYALWELARSQSDPEALRVPRELLDMVQPLFELGWALGLRTGHTGSAVTGVPVDRGTVARAFVQLLSAQGAARSLDPQGSGPVVWQKVEYHGSVTQRHGRYWVGAIHAHALPLGSAPELRYDLCEVRGFTSVSVVTNVRRRSLTPLPEFRALG